MRKHRKLMVIGVLASLAVLTLALGATALASSGDKDSRPHDAFITRVSEILGLEEGQLSEATEQAKEEMREYAQVERLAEAVDAGVITQEEADEISAWFDAKPEALSDRKMRGACEEAQTERLANAVESGVITQEEADEISAWFDAKPEVLSDLGAKKALCQRDGMKHRGADSEGNSLGKRDGMMCRGDEQRQHIRR